MLLIAVALAVADPTVDPEHAADRAKVAELNATVKKHNDEIAERAAKADAVYRQERQRYEEALAANDLARKTAQEQQQAYVQAQSRYESTIAHWQEDRKEPIAKVPSRAQPATSPRINCSWETPTGSLRQVKVCQ